MHVSFKEVCFNGKYSFCKMVGFVQWVTYNHAVAFISVLSLRELVVRPVADSIVSFALYVASLFNDY